MYIVAIGWLYVVTLMAFAEATATAGVLTFVFYGLFPVTLVIWLTGAFSRLGTRRKSQKAAQPKD